VTADRPTPVCPAGADQTRRVVAALWSDTAAAALGSEALARRERVVRSLRAAGRLGPAERTGWLTLAAILCGMTTDEACAVDASASAIHHRSGPVDVLADPWGDVCRHVEAPATVPGLHLATLDPTDAFGMSVAALAAGCLAGAAMRVDGRALPSAGVRQALVARLRRTGTRHG
jgi:hypothetical protein